MWSMQSSNKQNYRLWEQTRKSVILDHLHQFRITSVSNNSLLYKIFQTNIPAFYTIESAEHIVTESYFPIYNLADSPVCKIWRNKQEKLRMLSNWHYAPCTGKEVESSKMAPIGCWPLSGNHSSRIATFWDCRQTEIQWHDHQCHQFKQGRWGWHLRSCWRRFTTTLL
jgi:hypothetical protein